MSRYIVIEDFNGTISLVTDEDGNVKVFDNRTDACEKKNKCQHGVVVYLGKV